MDNDLIEQCARVIMAINAASLTILIVQDSFVSIVALFALFTSSSAMILLSCRTGKTFLRSVRKRK